MSVETSQTIGGELENSPEFVDWRSYSRNPWRYSSGRGEKRSRMGRERPIWEPDTNNATYIRWSDWKDRVTRPTNSYYLYKRGFPNMKEVFRHLDETNRGQKNGYRWNGPYETYRMKQDVIATLAHKLWMTPAQRKQAINLFTGLDLQRLGYHIEVAAFALCAYIVHSDETEREYHPQTSRQNADEVFTDMQEKLGIHNKQFVKIYGKVAHRVRTGDLRRTNHDGYQLDEATQFNWRTTDADNGDGWL